MLVESASGSICLRRSSNSFFEDLDSFNALRLKPESIVVRIGCLRCGGAFDFCAGRGVPALGRGPKRESMVQGSRQP